jgi:hypothetical protein
MKDWIPLFQTIIESALPLIFLMVVVILFWRKLHLVIEALVVRIQKGAPVKLGSLLDVGTAPKGVRSGRVRTATSEGAEGSGTPEEIKNGLLKHEYSPEISEELYLVHSVQETRPYSGPGTGLWLVRAYLEAYEDEKQLDEIVRVTYRLHETFSERVITTEARDKAFELWMNIYGEFNLIAYVERKNKPAFWLTRYLDLPGRPTN